MGRGSSGLNGGGGGGAAQPKANTPSGVSYQQFMAMSDDQKNQVVQDIINDTNITVPNYLDDSETTKVLYALGMNNKPTVVAESQFNSVPGREIYRTVYETGSMPPPTSADIIDQIRTGDYTQMSGKGGSAHGRAIYFATDFTDSAYYGTYNRNAMVTRAKINPNANIVSERVIKGMMQNDKHYQHRTSLGDKDGIALYALSHGIDGWYSGTYTMMVNRGVLTFSDQNRRISKRNSSTPARRVTASSWNDAAIAR